MQNSKRSVAALVLTLALSQGACATADQALPSPQDQPLQTVDRQESLPVIKTTVLGWSPLKKDQPLPPIHVEFEDNPELARVMQASLAAAGFPIAPHASTAEFRVRIDRAARPMSREYWHSTLFGAVAMCAAAGIGIDALRGAGLVATVLGLTDRETYL